jgi:DNA-binding beta-propeller fold protein YncE
VFDIDGGHRQVKTIALPEATIIRGVAAHAPGHRLYIAGDGETPDESYVLAYDLVTDRVLWKQFYPPFVDSLCVTSDGRRLYVAYDTDQVLMLDASDGRSLATVTATKGVHNVVCSLDGQRVYIGAGFSDTMTVIATADDSVLRHLGPFGGFVRPFTMDVDEHWVFANVNGLLGFEVADAHSGAILFRVSPPGFPFTSAPDYTQSHGVAMSPDGREVWIVDQPYNRVHIFDVTGLPDRMPKAIADVALKGSLSDPGPRQGREGWLQFSRDGRYVYVGDAGDVIESATRRIVAHLDALANTRRMLEIDFEGGVPVWASSRASMGGVSH